VHQCKLNIAQSLGLSTTTGFGVKGQGPDTHKPTLARPLTAAAALRLFGCICRKQQALWVSGRVDGGYNNVVSRSAFADRRLLAKPVPRSMH
jgi:hypothetical protein